MFSFASLHAFYKEYQERNQITEKQKEYIGVLVGDKPFEKVSEILSRPVNDWKDIKRDEVSKIIMSIKGAPFRPKNHDHIIVSTSDFEYGYQDSDKCADGKLYYVKLYTLLMIDYDNISLEEVKRILERRKDLTFQIYQTHNGFHVFIVSKQIYHCTEEAQNLMTELECDEFYRLYSYSNGYKIRLSPKKDRNEKEVATRLMTIGDNVDPECVRLLEIHDHHLRY